MTEKLVNTLKQRGDRSQERNKLIQSDEYLTK